MTSFVPFLAPLAFLFPTASLPPAKDAAATQNADLVEAQDASVNLPELPPGWFAMPVMAPVDAHQVRIEQHIILRISPRTPEMQNVVSEIHRRSTDVHWEERKASKCLPMASLVGVRIGGDDRLVLYTRDRSMFSARLDSSCSAREFYSGFYVEPSEDGKLCVKRDRLQSRSGASCQLSRIARLVPVAN